MSLDTAAKRKASLRFVTASGLLTDKSRSAFLVGYIPSFYGATGGTGGSSTDFYQYRIYRSLSSDISTFVLIGTSTTPNFTDTNVTPDTTYYYYITQVSRYLDVLNTFTFSESSPSSVISLTISSPVISNNNQLNFSTNNLRKRVGIWGQIMDNELLDKVKNVYYEQ